MDPFEDAAAVVDAIADGAAAANEMAAAGALEPAGVAQVQEMAAGQPAIEAALQQGNGAAAAAAVDAAAASNPTILKLKDFSIWVTKNIAGAGIAFGIMYGLNKAVAAKAKDANSRLSLTDYLTQAEAAFTKNGLTFDKQRAADDALSFPWIDCTK